jgi:hypothetical protein
MSQRRNPADRRYFIGGSDARTIMGKDENALLRLWREKRGEAEPEDLSGNLIVQLGLVTEDLNRRWYEANSGQVLTDIQRHVRHPVLRWMAATLDGRVESSGAVFEAKFMLPWSFSEEAAVEKYMPQLQHNMWVVAARTACGSTLPAPDHHGGAEILALRGERRAASPIWRRTTQAADRGRARRRHEWVQCLGGIRRYLFSDARCPRGTRTGEGRTQRPNAGGCQGSKGPRSSGQALEGWCREFRPR